MTTPGANSYRVCPPPCGSSFIPCGRGRRRKYCSPECSAKAQRLALERFWQNLPPELSKQDLQNAYAFVSRRCRMSATRPFPPQGGLGNLVSLAVVLEEWPQTRAAQYEYAREQLRTLRSLVALGNYSCVRNTASVFNVLLLADQSPDANRIKVVCDELLRDIGEPGNSRNTIARIEARSERVEYAWATEHQWVNLAKALLVHANACRQYHEVSLDRRYYRRALELFQGAIYILHGYCRDDDPYVVTILLHQAEQWKLRVIATHDDSAGSAQEVLEESEHLEALATKINTPLIWFDTRRQRAWYFMICSLRENKPSYLKIASEQLAQAREAFDVFSFYSSHLRMRLHVQLLHAETELLFMMGGKTREQALRHLNEYAVLCQQYPQAYQVHQLERLVQQTDAKRGWQGDFTAVFSAPFLPFLYLDETLLCLEERRLCNAG